jgi:hypothetical protein
MRITKKLKDQIVKAQSAGYTHMLIICGRNFFTDCVTIVDFDTIFNMDCGTDFDSNLFSKWQTNEWFNKHGTKSYIKYSNLMSL